MTTTTSTTVITNQPGSTGNAQVIQINQVQNMRDWHSNLCGCFEDIPSCLCAFFFGPCYQCHVANRMGEFCCVPYCVQGGLLAMRTKLRTQNNIVGGICSDCCIVTYCTPCAVAQMARELDHTN